MKTDQAPSVESPPEKGQMQGVAAVAGGSKGAPLMREYRGRIQLVDLAAYGAPVGSIGFLYLDLFFSPAAPSNTKLSNSGHPHTP